MLVPDLAVQWNGRQTRLRAIACDGFLLLTTGEFAPQTDVGLPVTVASMHDLDPSGDLAAALVARAGESWLIRPDAHIAAVLDATDHDGIVAALRRAVAAQPLVGAQRP